MRRIHLLVAVCAGYAALAVCAAAAPQAGALEPSLQEARAAAADYASYDDDSTCAANTACAAACSPCWLSAALFGTASLLFVVSLACTENTLENARLRALFVAQAAVFATLGAGDGLGFYAWLAWYARVEEAYGVVAIAAVQVLAVLALGGVPLLTGRAGQWLGAAAAMFGMALLLAAWLPEAWTARSALVGAARSAAAALACCFAWDQCGAQIRALKDQSLVEGEPGPCAASHPS